MSRGHDVKALVSRPEKVTPRTGVQAVRVDVQSRMNIDRSEWEHLVGSGRAAWYFQPRPRWTSELSLEGAGAWKTIFPFQLELGERRLSTRGVAGRDGK